MIRRFSQKVGFGKKKEDVNGTTNDTTNGTNGTHATNGITNGDGGEKPNLQKRTSTFMPFKAKKETTDHAASRADVESSFAQFAQLIHASRRPLPTQTGDGAYLDHAEPSGLLSDIRSMGFKDAKTLMDVMKTKATGELQDDKTYIMERTIQVSCPRMCGLTKADPIDSSLLDYLPCQRPGKT